MKLLSAIAVVILLACGGALWFLASGSLNEFIKVQIETVGKQVTEQTVTVGSVDIQLTEGAGSILGMSIANPKKYSYPHLFTLGEITLDINVESLSTQPIIIDALIIKNPKAFVQLTETGEANIKDLLDTIERNLPKSESSSGEQPKNNQAEPKISVTKVVLAGTSLSLDLSALGNSEHQVNLPDITLNNIGGENGLPASELGSVIAKEALSAIWKQTKNTQKEKLKKQAKDKIEEKLKDKAKKKLSELFNKS